MSITVNPSVFVRTPTNRTPAGCCPCTFASIYESKQALCVVQKQRFVCWFSGSCLSSIWTTDCHNPTNCFQMSDAVNGGFEIVTGSVSGDTGHIHYNDQSRHYSETGSVFIAVIQSVTTTSSVRVALVPTENQALTAGFSELGLDTTRNTSFFSLTTFCGVCGTCITPLCEAVDTCRHMLKIEHKACTVEATIDTSAPCVGATNSCFLPNCKLQPDFFVGTTTGTSRTGRISYIEAYNT